MSRMKRIESLLKQEIARIIQAEFRYNLGLVSITAIRVAKDLARATVYYSHFGSESEQRKTNEKLTKSRGFIQRKLNKTIRLKRIPELVFKLDDSLARGSHLIETLNKVSK